MRVLLCNKYFFLNGGTEKYLRDIMEQLASMGHTPVPFSVRYDGSWQSAYTDYFLPPPAGPGQAHFGNIAFTPLSLLRLLDRSIYSWEARSRLEALLRHVGGTDIAYLLNIYNYMSPSIVHTLRRHNIPIAMQLGDYHLLCPAYVLLKDGRPCTLCVSGAYRHGLRHRCVKNSLPASAVRVAAMYVQKLLGIYKLVDAFIVPCRFMRDKLVEGGFPADRIHLLRYPVAVPRKPAETHRREYILYFGRITFEKGLDTLIQAYQDLAPAVDLVLAGRGYDGEVQRLRGLIRPEFSSRIRFPGFQGGDELSRIIGGALFSVVPSRWYDNAPISVYDSFAHGTPVLAAAIGGIPEQIQEGVTGMLFEPDSRSGLREALGRMLDDRRRLARMGAAGFEYASRNLTMQQHAESLLELFEKTIQGHHEKA